MKKIILFVICCLICLNLFSQGEASNWYFGYGGGITFNQNTNAVSAVNDGQLSTNEGCATISNSSGELLFYTDGITVWNKNHLTMINGNDLFGDPSSTQSAIIVPKPGNEDIYYVFTVDDHGFNEPHLGLNYSEVDMSLNGGLGAVTTKNVNLLPECSEKITAVLNDCVSQSIWVLTLASQNGDQSFYNTYHAFEVNETGVNTRSIKSPIPTFIYENRGYLKLSPDGNRLASANVKQGLYLYDFDTTTGKVSNQRLLNISGLANGSYGIEFSPNSNLLYVHASNDFFDIDNPSNNEVLSNHTSKLIQYNLLNSDIVGTSVVIDDRNLYRGALQLGPNGKIYRALSVTYSQGTPYLGVINNPNKIGTACNYQHNAVYLSTNNSSQGLPPFIQSFFNEQIDIIKNGSSSTNLALCVGDTYTLAADEMHGASYSWTLNGNSLPETDFNLEVVKSGHYQVYIDPNNGDCAIEGEAFVNYNENPEAFNHTLLQCDEDGTVDGLTLFNLNQANAVLTNGVAGLSTRFYTDAARTNIINGDAFTNTINPQTIYVDVVNNNTGCYSPSELTLDVSVTDSGDTELIVCDDDGIEDGFYNFNLNNANNAIVNGLPTGLTIAYYQTYDDALLEVNNLGTSFTNTNPYSQIIYARVENANNCYGISEVQLTVNELPNIETEKLAYYCLNTSPTSIPLNAAIINDSPSNYTYSWSTGENTYQININQVGTYTATVTNTNGCSKQRTITVEPSNIATFKNIEVVDATQNNTITVLVSGEGIYEYRLLDQNNVVYAPYQESNIFENVYPGLYTVTVRDIKNNCGTVEGPVSVIGFPKFFTPNNDGVHDTWQVLGVSSMFQPNTKVLIFNRFGKLIKQLNPLGNGWDGLFNGERLPADDYWFAVTLQDGRIFKNHFTLKY
ncbi:T9SS type B sorting domain-containing protein [Sabulilitoribacter arenilitoris]|uniref:T9SS type B sorting domain-containing protein n=1 Tax=Wocania arenilitoris TaxID=2044858 RepID=A0AAE3ENT1_9FLAO|nr:T9SS type B sorting domain-containing protein [Wocania arenilitoris]MCF7568212.1 T9SS type B sorting domain-containing protein [Wocania arenilitoris]